MKFDPSEYPFGSHPRGAPSLHRRSALSGLAALALSPFGNAQAPTTLPRVGMLCFGSPGNLKSRVDVFLAAMRQVGYVEGRNVRYEMRYGNGQRDLLNGLATELVEKGADVIVSGSTFATPPLMQATKTIPIVMVTAEEALATSRQPTRPAPNVTGTVNNALDQVPRSFQLTAAVVPNLARVAALIDPANAAYAVYRSTLESAARASRLRLELVEASTRNDFERAIERAATVAQAMVVMSDANFYNERRIIVELVLARRIPAMYPQRGYVEAGGLMSYGQSIEQGFVRAAAFVDRILKGAKPADVPLELPSKVEFAINRYTATNMGLAIPPEVLKRADRVVG